MLITIGADHNCYQLKERLVRHLAERSPSVKDFGCFDPEQVAKIAAPERPVEGAPR